MLMINDNNKLLLVLSLLAIIVNLDVVFSTPIDTSSLASLSDDGGSKDNSTSILDENSINIQRRKPKPKRRKQKDKSSENKEEDVVGNMLKEFSAIFASFLSTVEDISKDTDAISVIRNIADSVNQS